MLSVNQEWRWSVNGTHREMFQYKWGDVVSTWNTRQVTYCGEQIEWVDTTLYLVVTLDTRLTWSTYSNHIRKRTAQRMGMLGPY